jgi:hypothetical protein
MEALKKSNENLYLSSKSIGIDFFKAYQDQDIKKMLSFCDKSCMVSFIPLGEQGNGNVHQVGKAIWEALIASFPSIQNKVNKISLENGRVVCDVTIWGRQEKDFAGLVSKGNEFEEGHIFIFKVNERNKVENLTINWNHENLVTQLTA